MTFHKTHYTPPTSGAKKAMHICFLTEEFPVLGRPHGGIGTLIKALAEALVTFEVQVSVITRSGSQEEQSECFDKGIRIISLPISSWRYFKYIDRSYRLNRAIRLLHQRHPIDIIEGSEIAMGFIRKIKGIKYLIRMNGGHHFFAKAENRPTEPRKAIREIRSFKKADALLAVSQYVNTTTAAMLGFDPQSVTIIPNAINTDMFSPRLNSQVIPHRILFAGSVVEKKGIRQLIMALPIVRKKYPDAHLVVFGNTNILDPIHGEPYMNQLQPYLANGLAEAVAFGGFINNHELQEQIALAEVCCYPSHMEALPLAWLEVMCSGKPFVGSKTGPGPELVQHGVDGLLCDPYNPNDIAEKIIYYFDYPEKAKAMGQAARKKILNGYDIRKVAQDNIRFYSSLLNA